MVEVLRLADLFRISPNIVVDWAMRYGQPSIPDRLTALKEAGLDHIIVVQVSESGASVYSASELAGKEFPEHVLALVEQAFSIVATTVSGDPCSTASTSSDTTSRRGFSSSGSIMAL